MIKNKAFKASILIDLYDLLNVYANDPGEDLPDMDVVLDTIVNLVNKLNLEDRAYVKNKLRDTKQGQVLKSKKVKSVFDDISEDHNLFIQKIVKEFGKYQYTNIRKKFRTFKWYGGSAYNKIKTSVDKYNIPSGIIVKYYENEKLSVPCNTTIIVPYCK